MPSMPHEGRRDTQYRPPGLTLQWHVTERCNLRCSHCYQDAGAGVELDFDGLMDVLGQYESLLGEWRASARPGEPTLRGHITVTGGEPFIRHDFLDLLDAFAAREASFSFAILTNGTLIDDAMARRLRALGPTFVQVSIDGLRTTHDEIRGPGSYENAVSAIRHLVRHRIRTLISFTAQRGNFREFGEVAKLARKLKVSRIWADRPIPCGAGEELRGLALTPDETREFFEAMHGARTRATRRWFGGTDVAMHRALQFLVAGGKPYRCRAGDSLVTIQPDGTLFPCRRMPISVGNVTETPLARLYHESELFGRLRDASRIADGCENCTYAQWCRGGLKCLSYATTGDPFAPDPGCWLAANRRAPDRGAIASEPDCGGGCV